MLDKLCVGAVSRRVIEEAARLNVAQIVASRRQVDIGGGYTGLDQRQLVELVRSFGGTTKVVRDHGGPNQGAEEDDGVASLTEDLAADFDGLHLDVCQLPLNEQEEALGELAALFAPYVDYEVGGEHTHLQQNWRLFQAAVRRTDVVPHTVVINAGAHIHEDRQCGSLNAFTISDESVPYVLGYPGVKTKLHNMDWVGRRHTYIKSRVDFYNIAPEFAEVEIDALLHILPFSVGDWLLQYAHDSRAWERWFTSNVDEVEGTWDRRARCAVRYVLEHPDVKSLIKLNDEQERVVRGRISDAILAG